MANRSFKHFVEQELGKFPLFLIYAVLEWVLILILFIDGFLAFAANEFAKFFELRYPCLLCTRIDHVLVHRHPDFYYNESICESHKKDVSSLAYCHVHKKLSDIRKMCEGCLLSFATERESDCDTYKSLLGILHKDLELLVDDEHEIQLTLPSNKKDDAVPAGKSGVNCCSCCGEPLKVNSHSKGKNFGLTALAPAPSPRASFKISRNESSRNLELPHVRYAELKLITDNESDFPVSEEEGASNALNKQLREDVKAVTVPLLTDNEDTNEDRTPTFGRGNRFFGIPLTDSAQSSPRWSTRLLKKSTLEKTDDGKESAEGQTSSEADSILHHLNRQVRLDRKSLMALYMELDEERSASAVAANNAMAMITRLQAEKAALQMDALQYQRMMEEQAEYDQEALQASKELLVKREEELKDLEAELEAYRLKYGCLREDEIVRRVDENDQDYQEFTPRSFSSTSGKSESPRIGKPACSSLRIGKPACSSPRIGRPECSTPKNGKSESSSSADGILKVSNDGETVKTNDQAGSSKDDNGERTDDKLLKSKQLGNLKNLDKRVHFSSDEGISPL